MHHIGSVFVQNGASLWKWFTQCRRESTSTRNNVSDHTISAVRPIYSCSLLLFPNTQQDIRKSVKLNFSIGFHIFNYLHQFQQMEKIIWKIRTYLPIKRILIDRTKYSIIYVPDKIFSHSYIRHFSCWLVPLKSYGNLPQLDYRYIHLYGMAQREEIYIFTKSSSSLHSHLHYIVLTQHLDYTIVWPHYHIIVFLSSPQPRQNWCFLYTSG